METKNKQTAYLLMRIAMGINIALHGIVRFPKLEVFSKWMVGLYENSMMPIFLVKPFSFALPFIEFVIGVFILFGLFTKKTLIAGSIVMLMLITGSCIIENWEYAYIQMVYIICYFILIYNVDVDRCIFKNTCIFRKKAK